MYPGNNGDSLKNPIVAANKIYVDDITNNSYISLPAIFPMAVSELHEDVSVDVYPNPTSGKFEITSSARMERIDIYNASGQKLVLNNQAQTGILKQVIDLSSAPRGIYILRIVTESGVSVRKLTLL